MLLRYEVLCCILCCILQHSLVASFSPLTSQFDGSKGMQRGHRLRYGSDGQSVNRFLSTVHMTVGQDNDKSVVELITEDSKPARMESTKISNAAPFMSQGEISKEALNPDFSDPRQTRAVIYTVISLLPVLFLIPLMIGSRDFIPPDSLPPVQM